MMSARLPGSQSMTFFSESFDAVSMLMTSFDWRQDVSFDLEKGCSRHFYNSVNMDSDLPLAAGCSKGRLGPFRQISWRSSHSME